MSLVLHRLSFNSRKKRTHINAFEEADTVNECSALTYRGGGARCKRRRGEDVMLRKRNLKHHNVEAVLSIRRKITRSK